MTKKEAKIEAMRIATAILIYPPDFEDNFSISDIRKIEKELKKISDSLYKRAVKLGGEFNQYTGY